MHRTRLVTILCAAIVALYASILALDVGRPKSWIVDDQGRPNTSDYIMMWAAGRLTLQGKPADVYDWSRHAETMAEGLTRREQPLPFHYPPYFLTVVAPFALLDYIPSLLAWSFLTLGLYLVVCARIVGRWQGALWLSASLVTLGNFVAGQNGFLSAALLGGGLLALPHRPLLAGALIGMLSYKPHLGVLIPLALAAAGFWRAFASAAATILICALASLALFGLAPWEAFIDNFGRFGGQLTSSDYPLAYKLQSAFGLLRTLGIASSAALAVQTVLALTLAAAVVLVWRSAAPYAAKAALLAAAIALASPYVFFYDLALLGVAQGFLIRHWLTTAITERHVIALAAVNMVASLFISLQLPVGFLASLMVLALALREAWPFVTSALPPRRLSGAGAR